MCAADPGRLSALTARGGCRPVAPSDRGLSDAAYSGRSVQKAAFKPTKAVAGFARQPIPG